MKYNKKSAVDFLMKVHNLLCAEYHLDIPFESIAANLIIDEIVLLYQIKDNLINLFERKHISAEDARYMFNDIKSKIESHLQETNYFYLEMSSMIKPNDYVPSSIHNHKNIANALSDAYRAYVSLKVNDLRLTDYEKSVNRYNVKKNRKDNDDYDQNQDEDDFDNGCSEEDVNDMMRDMLGDFMNENSEKENKSSSSSKQNNNNKDNKNPSSDKNTGDGFNSHKSEKDENGDIDTDNNDGDSDENVDADNNNGDTSNSSSQNNHQEKPLNNIDENISDDYSKSLYDFIKSRYENQKYAFGQAEEKDGLDDEQQQYEQDEQASDADGNLQSREKDINDYLKSDAFTDAMDLFSGMILKFAKKEYLNTSETFIRIELDLMKEKINQNMLTNSEYKQMLLDINNEKMISCVDNIFQNICNVSDRKFSKMKNYSDITKLKSVFDFEMPNFYEKFASKKLLVKSKKMPIKVNLYVDVTGSMQSNRDVANKAQFIIRSFLDRFDFVDIIFYWTRIHEAFVDVSASDADTICALFSYSLRFSGSDIRYCIYQYDEIDYHNHIVITDGDDYLPDYVIQDLSDRIVSSNATFNAICLSEDNESLKKVADNTHGYYYYFM